MNIRRHFISLTLAAALLLGLAIPALAEEGEPGAAGAITDGELAAAGALGEQVDAWAADLTGGAALSGTVFWTGSDLRTEYLLTRAPDSLAVPVVVSADPLRTQQSLTAAAEMLAAEGLHVLGGVNGGFYTVATGEPVGLTVSAGALEHDDEGLQAVGFRADGSVIFGAPALSMALIAAGERWTIAGWNRNAPDGFSAWTPGNAAAVSLPAHSACVLLSTPEAPGLSGDMAVTVEQTFESDGSAVTVPEGTLLLTWMPMDEETAYALPAAITPGAELTLSIACAAGWEDVTSAVGILYPLLENGETVEDLTAAAAPRTAIGLRSDGTLLLYALDGRQSGYSVGAGLALVAERMKELGCVTAGALDGGGSTQLAAFLPGEADLRTFNRPSETPARKVANYILLAARTEPSGIAEQLTMEPLHINAVAGATLPLTVRASDGNGYGAALPEDLTFTVSEGLGAVTDGQYIAAGTGRGSVTVSAPGLISGSIPLYVTESPEELALYGEKYGKRTESLTLDAGQTVDLTVRAYDRHVLLSGNDLCYTWALDESVGTVDETGRITAGDVSAAGTLTVTAGESVKTIPITVWTGIPFEDVPRSDPRFDAVKYVYDHGIFKGTGETVFEPETVMNRAMLVTVLWRMEGAPAPEATAGFADVPEGEWYSDAVAWASEQGIVNGYSPEEFGPTDDLTREQILTILHRWAELPEPPADGEALPEAFAADDWAAEALAWAAAAQVYVPGAEGYPDARGPMDRAGVADVLMRYETLWLPRLAKTPEDAAEESTEL
jgi:hypothetical protein